MQTELKAKEEAERSLVVTINAILSAIPAPVPAGLQTVTADLFVEQVADLINATLDLRAAEDRRERY